MFYGINLAPETRLEPSLSYAPAPSSDPLYINLEPVANDIAAARRTVDNLTKKWDVLKIEMACRGDCLYSAQGEMDRLELGMWVSGSWDADVFMWPANVVVADAA